MRQARDEWKAYRQPRMREEVHRLVFLDETGTTTKMTRVRGRARRGARLKAEKAVTAHPASLSRVLLKAGLSFKKNTAGFGDRARGRAPGA